MKDNLTEFFCALIGILVLVIFLPLLTFWCGYAEGWIAMKLFGNQLIKAMNFLFRTDVFTKEMIPWLGAALAWIGSFFKVVTSNKNR